MESIFSTLFPMIVIFAIFYFIIIRPQNKKRDDFKNMLDNMKKGDKVITAGGLKGTVKGFQGEKENIDLFCEAIKFLVNKYFLTKIIEKQDIVLSVKKNMKFV